MIGGGYILKNAELWMVNPSIIAFLLHYSFGYLANEAIIKFYFQYIQQLIVADQPLLLKQFLSNFISKDKI